MRTTSFYFFLNVIELTITTMVFAVLLKLFFHSTYTTIYLHICHCGERFNKYIFIHNGRTYAAAMITITNEHLHFSQQFSSFLLLSKQSPLYMALCFSQKSILGIFYLYICFLQKYNGEPVFLSTNYHCRRQYLVFF